LAADAGISSGHWAEFLARSVIYVQLVFEPVTITDLVTDQRGRVARTARISPLR
jgi:hypothetical protein